MTQSLRLSLVAAILGSLAIAPAVLARGGNSGSGGDDAVLAAGQCSGASSAKLKVKPEDGQLEIDFEVDQNVNNVTWNVRITDNDATVFNGTARTTGPSGSFDVEVLAPDRSGSDLVQATATNPTTGETCSASLTY